MRWYHMFFLKSRSLSIIDRVGQRNIQSNNIRNRVKMSYLKPGDREECESFLCGGELGKLEGRWTIIEEIIIL